MAVRPKKRRGGFSYVLLLVLIAVMSIVATMSIKVGASVSRHHAEQALLATGDEITAALLSYRRSEGVPASAGPAELAELLHDPRVPGTRRHLRRIPVDSLTGAQQWGVQRDAANRIIAVYSLAAGVPTKRVGFGPLQQGFENAETYAQWRFGFVGGQAPR